MTEEIRRAEAFSQELLGAYGDALVSVVLYGSAARGDFQPGVSDLNLLALLRDADAATLRRGSAAARGWVAEGNPPPLVWGAEEWRRSADVFPIEIADIRDAHRVLWGTDPFGELRIDWEHLRHQCEYELKGKHIQLRERYLLSAGEPAELAALLTRSISTFLVLFRTVLRLLKEPATRDSEAVIREVAGRAEFDPKPLLDVLRLRRDGAGFHPSADDPTVTGYLDAVARTSEFVDRLRPV